MTHQIKKWTRGKMKQFNSCQPDHDIKADVPRQRKEINDC